MVASVMVSGRPQLPQLGDILVQQGIVSRDQIKIALTEQKKNGNEFLGQVLVRLGFVTESIILDVVSAATGQQSVDLEHVVPDNDAILLIPKDLARQLTILPLTFDKQANALTVAMTDTFNVIVLDKINAHLGETVEIVPLLAGEADIEKAIDLFYGFELSVDGILNEIETGEIDGQSLNTMSAEYSQPVVRLVNALLLDAIKRGASDIHFEPEDGFLRFRYRIDGVLRQIGSLHKNYWPAIVVRIKIMAGMDIAETRAPQDGRTSLVLFGRQVNFRVSTLPTVHGENIVLRILEKNKSIINLDRLGFSENVMRLLRLMLTKPEGIILITGPTGSGKTTTLYSMLNDLNTEAVNIMTLEDPVEYPTTLIRQTSINETVKLSFAGGIRTLMRQDPDIILVGEIRDEDTASMALNAAMTGHQVFSTLHTNSAIGAIPRLLSIGVAPDLLAGNLTGIVAQRLVRKLCASCRAPVPIDDSERVLLGVKTSTERRSIYRADGCSACDYTGYKHRIPLGEALAFDKRMDELLIAQGTQTELLRAAHSKGFETLADAGVACVLNGASSLEEVTRVVSLGERGMP